MHDEQVILDTANEHPSWRTEPEIDEERQAFLRQRLAVVTDVQQGVYPFRSVRLSRADVEWLLVTHEQGRGPVEWHDVSQQRRQGIDVRGADLREVNLRNLPLAGMCGGLTKDEWVVITLEQRAWAGVHLERADLSGAHLEGALLRGAFLQGASLRATHLEQAVLFNAHLEQAYLRKARLEGANMASTHLEGAYLREAYLAGTDLRHVVCDNGTNIEKVMLFDKQWGCALLADVRWGDCNLALIDWRSLVPLGDELLVRKLATPERQAKSSGEKQRLLDSYQAAVRAYRQLANALRAQGMNEEAVPFAYRALVLQRGVLWRQVLWGQVSVTQSDGVQPGQAGTRQRWHNLRYRVRSFGSYIFSWFLNLLAGYGHKPGRSLFIYLLTIIGFAGCYLVLGQLSPLAALIFSITSFHGRGFFPGPFSLGAPVTALAALEAVMGIFVEISFIATFTQRFFGR